MTPPAELDARDTPSHLRADPGGDAAAMPISTAALARAPGRALGSLRRWRLVQEPASGRFALHAVVRHALLGKGDVPAERYFAHYIALLERHPDRFAAEQSHVCAAMDHAQAASSLGKILRVEALLGG